MAKISALEFTRNVNQSRKNLIQHCLENGKQISDTESLDNVIAINNTINVANSDGKYKVEFKNLDGSYFAPTQYVSAGGSVELPSEIPTFDSEYLEFSEWQYNGDLNNVQSNILCMPIFKTKIDGVTNQRPTIMVCYFSEDALSPTFAFGSQSIPTYVNWGDGSEPEQISGNTQHNYTSAGQYIITIYGEQYGFAGSTSAGMFSNSTYRYSLIKFYSGENLTKLPTFEYSNSLSEIVFNNKITYITNFNNCYSLESVVIPDNVSSIGSFQSCYSLKNVIIGKGVKSLSNQTSFSLDNSLETLIIPSSLNSINASFGSNYGLKYITIPSTVSVISSGIFASCSALKNIVLYNDFDVDGFDLHSSPLTDECIVDIANKLKDNNGITTKTIKFSLPMLQSRMNTIYLNEFGERVPYGTAGAVSVLQFMTDKNWTVSFS